MPDSCDASLSQATLRLDYRGKPNDPQYDAREDLDERSRIRFQVLNDNGNAPVVESFVNSPEYRNRFGS